MARNVEIPTQSGRPFSERVPILDAYYTLYFKWNKVAKCWVVDFWDDTGTIPLVLGVPLVTGCDLLEQFGYFSLGWSTILTVMCIGPDMSPDSVPTFRNLGTEGHLFATTP